jgi:hypothetical protein
MNFKIKTTIIQEQEITIPCFPYFAMNENKDQAICIHSEKRCTHLFAGGKDLLHYYISGGASGNFNKAFDKGWSPCSASEYRELVDLIMTHVMHMNRDYFQIDQAPASAEDASLKLNLQNPEGDE